MRDIFYKHFVLRQIFIVRPRLFFSALTGLSCALLLPSTWIQLEITRLLIGWNISACLYLVLCAVMISSSSQSDMHKRACREDDGQAIILLLVILATLASLAAIVDQLAEVKTMASAQKYPHIALAVLTIFSSWAFTHMMFAMHYAHDFYISRAKGLPGGLEFPQDDHPDYGDFCYFAFIIGTSAQTADVSFTNKSMRRVGLVHCVLAFLFNTTLLALTINIAASLF